MVELYAYTPYGKQTVMDAAGNDIGVTAQNNFYGFTGRYKDVETGLWYFRARYYSDELGRFISRDPLGFVDGMSLYAGYFAMGFGLDPSGLVSPWNIGGTYAEDVPSVNLGCRVLEGMIKSFLRTDKEREAWDHYVSGAGTPIQLTRDEIESIIFASDEVINYLEEENRECSHDDDAEWSSRKISMGGSAPNPWIAAIGGYSVEIETSCNCECMRWSAEINDIYDFDPQYFSTHRNLEAELQTIAVNWADKIAQCGWREFYHKGSTNGNMGNCED